MKIFLISQEQNRWYDTYDSAVVIAESEKDARQMDPRSGERMTEEDWERSFSNWCNGPEHVHVQYLGDAVEGTEKRVVCASFNAG